LHQISAWALPRCCNKMLVVDAACRG
jgi:hypothetical protein